ncbi:hypothetical protein SDC9_131817 [bioreactor metagenome]|uniref:Uncharacterized protein n=1 Tax=bioreactor metagenome TaxID=1076179 RepID=A0A645D668_9ZZZZ
MIQLLRRSNLLKMPIVHDCNRVTHDHGFALVVGDVHKGCSHLRLQCLELHFHMFPQFCIERTQRFIEQEYGWFHDQAPRNGNALFLSAGELADLFLSRFRKADPLQQRAHFPVNLRASLSSSTQTKGNVFVHVHHGKECQILEDQVHRPFVGGYPVHVLPIEQECASIGFVEPGNHPQKRCFAASGGA